MRRTGRITTIALSTLAGAGSLAPLQAQAATGKTIYVDNASAACSNAGAMAGSQATPYCDLSVAGLTALPGDTVLVSPSATSYQSPNFFGVGQPATVNGAPGSPITFKAAGAGVKVPYGFAFEGQHDFVLDGFDFPNLGAGFSPIWARSSQNISVLNSTFTETSTASNGTGYAVRFDSVTGGSVTGNTMTLLQDSGGIGLNTTSGIDVQHNTISSSYSGQTIFGGMQGIVSDGTNNHVLNNTVVNTSGASVAITANGSGTLVANNYLKCGNGGVQITGASNVAVAGNTIIGAAGSELSVSGTVSGISVENNIASIQDNTVPCSSYNGTNPNLVGLSVDAVAAPGVTADYNDVYIPAVGNQYSWAGSNYFYVKDFNSASHQGAHDTILWPHLDVNGVPMATSAAIDNANSSAAGEQKTDRLGNPRHDDPGTTNTGAGTYAYYDRGAFEFEGDSTSVTPPAPPPAPTPGPGPNPGPAGTGPSVRQIGGADRYSTGILVSQNQWQPGQASAVVLARGDQAPDALAGVPLASHVHGPLLLTDPRMLEQPVRSEIDRVLGGPTSHKTVYILGGVSAVSQSTEDSLRTAGYTVTRFAGGDRFATALAVARSFGVTSHVIVATGKNFPDALAAGPLGAVENSPIVLSDDTVLDPTTAQFVLSHGAIEAVGGQANKAVGALSTAGKTVKQLAGGDRYATGAAVAAQVSTVTGHVPTQIGIASGMTFPDALTGGAFAANAGMPLLLTDPAVVPTPTADTLIRWASQLTAVTIFGGPGAVNGTALTTILTDVHGHQV